MRSLLPGPRLSRLPRLSLVLKAGALVLASLYGCVQAAAQTALTPTVLSLFLCVDAPGSNFPCGNPLSATPLVNPITMYFGQTLDGVVIESATTLGGSITLFDGPTAFCVLPASLQGGTNMCPTTSGILPVGSATVIAVYSGDATYAPSTSNGILVNVLPDLNGTSTLTSSLNPSILGQPVTLTANMQGNFATPAGTVQFYDGSRLLGQGTLDANGNVSFTTSTLAVGTHPITAVLPGSANFQSITTPVVNQVITPAPVPSTVGLTSNLNPSSVGQAVSFTATVSVPATTASGIITFLDGAATLGSASLNAGGVATFATSSLAAGTHPITASFAGSAGALAGVSPVLTQVVAVPVVIPPFTLTVTPVPVTLGVGRTAMLQVSATGGSSRMAPVQLACSNLPDEVGCLFSTATIPAGNGAAVLSLTTKAPRPCGTEMPFFLGPAQSLRRSAPAAAAVLACILFLPGLRRRRLTGRMTLVLAVFCALTAISGCGNCTDLGTRPGSYSFTVTASTPSESASQVVRLTMTLP